MNTQIPIAVPNISGNEADYLMECVRTGFVSSVGPFVNRFEDLVAKATGAASAVATSSGTTGLHLALTALGVTFNDIVIIPSFTFIASANAVSHCGAQPWCLDIDAESWCLSPSKLRQTISEECIWDGERLLHRGSGRRIAAIMPVYTLGTPADMNAIAEVASLYRLPIIADAAAAIGATYQSRPLAELADLSVISFNGNKTLTAGGGGAVFGNNRSLLELVRHLSTTARSGEDYDHDMIGFNYRMTNLQAAVGCAQLERLDEFILAKREIRTRYDEAFASLSSVHKFPQPDWANSACWLSGFFLTKGDTKNIICSLREQGIPARSFWKPIHMQTPYNGILCGDMANTERTWKGVVVLPCSTNIPLEDQKRVILIVKALLT